MAKFKNTNMLRPMSVRDVPEPVRHAFHVACLAEGVTMQEVIVACMRYLDTPEKIKDFLE